MNKIFKIIWNSSLQCFVVVSELSKSKGKSSSSTDKRISLAKNTIALAVAGGTIIGGQALAATEVSTVTNIVEAWGGQVNPNPKDDRDLTMALGNKSYVHASASIAIGVNARTEELTVSTLSEKQQHPAALPGATSPGSNSVAIGVNAKARGQQATALGNAADAVAFSTAIGQNAKANGAASVAVGHRATADATNSTALGVHAQAQEKGSVSLGRESIVSGEEGTAVGYTAKVTGVDGSALGSNSVAGTQATASGADAKAEGTKAIATGYQANASATSSIAIGDDAKATDDNSVALGSGATTSAAVATNKADVNGFTYEGFQGITPTATVSVGNGTTTRTITNLASGRITKGSTDAINGSQLYAVANELGEEIKSIYFHANTNDPKQGAGDPTTNKGKISDKAGATGAFSVTAGVEAKAISQYGIAIGKNSNSTGSAVVIGANAAATGLEDDVNTANREDAQQGANGAVAIGENARASASKGSQPASIAIGQSATAAGVSVSKTTMRDGNEVNLGTAIAIGAKATAKDASVAIGQAADAGLAQFATAVGVNSRALGDRSSAYGVGSLADAQQAVAVGFESKARAQYTTAIGSGSLASQDGATAIGSGATSQSTLAIALGKGSLVHSGADRSMSIGDMSEAHATATIAQGYYAIGKGADGVAIGTASRNFGANSTAVGSRARGTGASASAFGHQSHATGDNTTAVGRLAIASGANGIAIGQSSLAGIAKADVDAFTKAQNDLFTNERSTRVAQGNLAEATAKNDQTNVTKYQAELQTLTNAKPGLEQAYTTAKAKLDTAKADTIAIGTNTKALGTESIAIGKNSNVTGSQSIAVGVGHTIAANNSGAFGDPNIIKAGADGSYAVGNNNTITTANTFVLGSGINRNNGLATDGDGTVANSVYLGHESEVTRGAGIVNASGEGSLQTLDKDQQRGTATTAGATGTVSSAKVGPLTYGSATIGGQTFAGAVSKGAVSVGSSGDERRIQNVAAGEISKTSTDAINGSQLYAVAHQASKPITFTANSNKDGANGTMSYAGENGLERILGDEINIQGANSGLKLSRNDDTATTGAYSARNVQTVVDNSGVQIQIAENPIFTSVQLGSNTGPKISNAGDNINVGKADDTPTKITNVANGTNPNDAVNLSQLNATRTVVEKGDNTHITTTDIAGGGKTYTVHADKTVVQNGAGLELNTSPVTNANGTVTTTYTLSAKTDGTTITTDPNGNLVVNTGTSTVGDTGKAAVTGGDVNNSKVATVGDIVNTINNVSWNVFEATTAQTVATKKDKVTAGDNVVFKAGTNTTVNVESDGTTTSITYDVDFNNIPKTSLVVEGAKVNTPSTEEGGKLVNASTVANAINQSGWKTTLTTPAGTTETINPGDTVNYKDGVGTTAKVVKDGDTVVNVSYDAKIDNTTITTDATSGNLKVNTGTFNAADAGKLATGTDGIAKVSDVVTAVNAGYWTAKVNGTSDKNVKFGDKVNFVNGTATVAEAKANGDITFNVQTDGTTIGVDENGKLTVKGDALKTTVKAGTGPVEVSGDGTAANPYTVSVTTTTVSTSPNQNADGSVGTAVNDDAVLTAKNVLEVVKNAGFKLTASENGGKEEVTSTEFEVINPGDTVDMAAGKNLVVKQEANGKITYATADDVSFNSVTTKNLTATGDTNVKNFTVGAGSTVDMGGNKVTNIADGTAADDAVSLQQLNATKVVVKEGKNTKVTSTANATTGGTDYTVDAVDTSASTSVKAGFEDYLTVAENGTKEVDNATVKDYAISLTDKAKNVFDNAATSVEDTKTVDLTLENGKLKADVKAVDGKGTAARVTDNGLTFDVKTDGTTIKVDDNGNISANTTTLSTKPLTDKKAGSVEVPSGKGNNLVTAEEIAKAINNSGWSAIGGKTGTGTSAGTASELINPGDTVTFIAGDNLHLDQVKGAFTYSLQKNIVVDSVKANTSVKVADTVSITKDGIDAGNTQITNVASGGEKDSNGANIGDIKRIAAQSVEKVVLDDKVTDNIATVNTESGKAAGKAGETYKVGVSKEAVKKAAKEAIEVKGDGKAITVGNKDENGVKTFTVNYNGAEAAKTTPLTYKANGKNAQTVNLSEGLNFTNGDKTVATVDDNGVVTFDLSEAAKKQLDKEETVKAASSNVIVNGDKTNNTGGKEFAVDIAKNLDLSETGSVKMGDTTVNNDGLTIKNGPSVTNKGIDAGNKVISNVKAGEAPTDAVNVSQLTKAVGASKEVVKSTDGSIKVDDSKTTADGAKIFDLSVKVDSSTITNGKNGLEVATGDTDTKDGKAIVTGGDTNNGKVATVGDVVNTINSVAWTVAAAKVTGTNGMNEYTSNEQSKISAGDSVTTKAGKNIKLAGSGDNLEIHTVDNAEFTSVKFGDNGPVIKADNDNNINVGKSDGSSPTKITGVADGTGNNDAVNVKQLKAAKTEVVSRNKSISVKSEEAADGHTIYNVELDKAVATADDGLKFTGNDSTKVVTKKLNETLTVRGDLPAADKASAKNVRVDVVNGELVINVAEAPVFDKVTTGDTSISDEGLVVNNGPKVTKSGIDAGNKAITNVADGKVSGDSKDAVNGSQLYETNKGWTITTSGNTDSEGVSSQVKLGKSAKPAEKTVTISGGKNIKVKQEGNTVTVATSDTPVFDKVTVGGEKGVEVSVRTSEIDGKKELSVGTDNAPTRITNVADGMKGTDAVNFRQLKQVQGNINAVNRKVDKLDKRVRGIGASSAAASSLPQVYIPGKSMVAAAAGGYGGASAVAVGYSRASDNGKLILKLQGTANSQGHVSGGVGVGYQW